MDEFRVTCPAGRALDLAGGGVACRCAIEDSVVGDVSEGTAAAGFRPSLRTFCAGESGVLPGHVACPTWRAEKERVWAGRHRALIDDYQEQTSGPRAAAREAVERYKDRTQGDDRSLLWPARGHR